FGSLEIDDQFVLGRRLHWKIGRLLALEDAVHVAGRTPVLIDDIRPIGDQTAGTGEVAERIDRRQLVPGRKLRAIDVIDVLSDLFILRGVPAHIRSDNGPEFVAKAVQDWIALVGAKTAYIE